MPIYQFRDRVLKFKEEAMPTFPSDAKISAKLEPLPPFGGEKGVTRNFSKDVKMMAKASPSTGRFFFEMDKPLFPRLSARRVVGTEVFSINGNVVSVESRVQSLQDVENLLDTLCYVFPAVLNLELPDSPYTLYAWGHIGGAKFQLHYASEQIKASTKCTSKEIQEQYCQIVGTGIFSPPKPAYDHEPALFPCGLSAYQCRTNCGTKQIRFHGGGNPKSSKISPVPMWRISR